jgi:hypothetical protein
MSGSCTSWRVWMLAGGGVGLLFALLAPARAPAHAQLPDDPGRTQSPDSLARATARGPLGSLLFPLPDVTRDTDLMRQPGAAALLMQGVPGAPSEAGETLPPATRSEVTRVWFGAPARVPLPAPTGLAAPHAQDRLDLALAPGPTAVLSFAHAPQDRYLAWGDADLWRERIPGRRHAALAFGGILARDLRLSADVALEREGWDPAAGRPWLTPGEMRAWRLRAAVARRFDDWPLQPCAGARFDAGGVDTRTCRESACPPGESWLGHWMTGVITAASPATTRDLRAWQTSDYGGRRSLSLLYELQGGLALHDASRAKAATLGRWRGGAGVRSGLGRQLTLLMGLSGGGEGARSSLGPWIDLRALLPDRGLLGAIEVAPQVVFPELALTWDERIPPASLLLDADGGRTMLDPVARAALPVSPVLVATHRDPQIAWPRVSAELLRQSESGWLLVEGTYARVRDATDWAADSLGEGGLFYRSVAAPKRDFARFAFEGTRVVSRALEIHLRYRWIHSRAQHRDLCFLPAHALTLRVDGGHGGWLWQVAADLRSRASAGDGRPELGAFVALDARLGWSFGPGTLSVIVENLLGDDIAVRPGDVVDGPRAGLTWTQSW